MKCLPPPPASMYVPDWLTQPSQAVYATSAARLFYVHAYVHRGEHHLAHALYTESRGLLRRWFASGPASAGAGAGGGAITRLAVGPAPGDGLHVLLYALSAHAVQVWRVPLAGSGAASNQAKLLLADDQLQKTIASRAMYARGQRYSAAASAQVALVDVSPIGASRMVVLYADHSGEGPTVAYGLALLSVEDESSLALHQVVPFDYVQEFDPQPSAAPRLALSTSSPRVAFVTFPGALVTKLLSDTAGTVEETIYLKAGTNRLLGASLVPAHEKGAQTVRWAALTSTSGVLLADMDVTQAEQLAIDQQPSSPRMQESRVARLQERLEKVVWFGEDAKNPLQLDLLPDSLDTALLQSAVEQLSTAIVAGSLSSMPLSVDLRTALAQRVACARRLIVLVGQNGYLMQMARTTRLQLRSDAELLSGANDLWRYFDESGQKAKDAHHVLPTAIRDVLGASDATQDLERLFFEKKVDAMPQLLEALLHRVAGRGTEHAAEHVETTRLVLALRFGAARYRADHGEAYALDAAPNVAYEPWYAHASSIELLETLYRNTLLLLQRAEEKAKKGSARPAELRTQLCALAEFAMDTYDARIAFLEAASHEDGGEGAVQALEATQLAYNHARPALLHPLMEVGRADKAFALAEEHHDYKTLTALCFAEVRDESGKRAKHSHTSHEQETLRVEAFLDRYGMPFADELYQYYIQHGAFRKLFEPQPDHATLVLAFLEAHPQYNRIAWVHDVLLQRFDHASAVLGECAMDEHEDIQAKQAMLSLGKLAQLATLSDMDTQLEQPAEQAALESWDDQLDLVHVQHRLEHKWSEAAMLPGAAPEAAAERIAQTVATHLTDKPGVRALFVMLATQLLTGSVASGEDMMDLLALQDTDYAASSGTALSDFAIAVQVYVRVQLDEARKEAAIATLWRRLYLQDDWYALSATAHKTDEGVLREVRGTVAYATIQAVLANDSTASVVLSPDQVCQVQPPTQAMLAERFPGLPADQVAQLQTALVEEHAALDALVAETKLGAFFAQVLSQPPVAEEEMVEVEASEPDSTDGSMEAASPLVPGAMAMEEVDGW